MCNILGPIICLLAVLQVIGDDCPYDGYFVAFKTPSITDFNQTLMEPSSHAFNSQDIAGIKCKWTIESVDDDKIIRLSFPSFHLIYSSEFVSGDCISVYDSYDDGGDSLEVEGLIQQLCNRMPEPVYNSSGKYMTIVFLQGGHGGRRWISMNYTMIEPTKTEKEDAFWSTTVGRVLSFFLVIIIFGFFSFAFKSCRKQNSCLSDFAFQCREEFSGCNSRCTNLFKSHTQSPASRTQEEADFHNLRLGNSSSVSRDQRINSDIATISGSQRLDADSYASATFPSAGTCRSVLDDSASELSVELDVQSPPPDYSSVLTLPNPLQIFWTARTETTEEITAPPHYSTLQSSSIAADQCEMELPLWHFPPPVDGSAPPSYDLPEPPAYESLFKAEATDAVVN